MSHLAGTTTNGCAKPHLVALTIAKGAVPSRNGRVIARMSPRPSGPTGSLLALAADMNLKTP